MDPAPRATGQSPVDLRRAFPHLRTTPPFFENKGWEPVLYADEVLSRDPVADAAPGSVQVSRSLATAFLSALGHEQTSRNVRVMSVIPLIVLQNSIDGGGEA
jgi:hypothetical protein